MSAASRCKRCSVVYATRERQYVWNVELAPDASIEQALCAARALAGSSSADSPDVPWDTAAVGIFGEVCARTAIPADGDRIEIYRPLSSDPRERRRERVRSERRATGRRSGA